MTEQGTPSADELRVIADRVLVLEHGRIVEDGSPARLISGGGRYATLHHQWRDSLV